MKYLELKNKATKANSIFKKIIDVDEFLKSTFVETLSMGFLTSKKIKTQSTPKRKNPDRYPRLKLKIIKIKKVIEKIKKNKKVLLSLSSVTSLVIG